MKIDPTVHLKYDSLEYTKEYNKYRKRWRLWPKMFKVTDFPMHVDLELNTHCNLRCIMCIQNKEPLGFLSMSLPLIQKIMDEISENECYAMKFNHRGEPLLATHLTEAIHIAKKVGIMETMINTNATLLLPNKIKELVDVGLDRIIFSVDSHIPEIYNKIRIGGNFHTVLTNITTLYSYKQLKGIKKPECRIQMVAQELNSHTTKDYIKFWKPFVDQVVILEMFDYFDREWSEDTEKFSCPQPFQRLMVHADGLVYPCCSMTAASVGNVYDMKLKEIWNNHLMKFIRDHHRSGESYKVNMCNRCYMRKKAVRAK